MRRKIIKTEKYIFDIENEEYMVYVLSEEENTLDFYIQKKQYGIMSYVCGIQINDLDCSVGELIENNIYEWINVCEHDITKLES